MLPSLVVLLAVLAAAVLLARRLRADVALSTLLGLCGALVVASVAAVALVPVHELFGFAPHEFRWLWALGAVIATTVGWAVAELTRCTRLWRTDVARRDAAAACAIAAVIALNVSNVGAREEAGLQPREPAELRALLDDLPVERLRACDGLAVEITMGFPALEFSSVLLALREDDVEFALRDPYVQFGFDRPATGSEQCLLTIADEVTAPTADHIANDAGVSLTLSP
jgi:hypothetical protein